MIHLKCNVIYFDYNGKFFYEGTYLSYPHLEYMYLTTVNKAKAQCTTIPCTCFSIHIILNLSQVVVVRVSDFKMKQLFLSHLYHITLCLKMVRVFPNCVHNIFTLPFVYQERLFKQIQAKSVSNTI